LDLFFVPTTAWEYNKTMDNTGQLINYIVQELKRGVPEASIRSTLLQNGWPTEPVNRAFGMLSQSGPAAAAAELPPVSNVQPNPQPQPVQIRTERATPPQHNKPIRQLLIVGLILLLLAVGALVAFMSISRQPADPDTARRDSLNSLTDKLAAYYTARGTYPTRDELNSSGFASTQAGFDISKYHDPAWEKENTKCKDKAGRAILVESRAKGCFTYRATALNGDDCNGGSKKCTRVVLTATLASDKPYIVGLDQNKKEKY
jgi:hypothetical protein